MIRTIIWFFSFWISLIGLLPSYLKTKQMDKPYDQFLIADRNAKKWSTMLLKRAGTKIDVTGLDLIPTDGPILFIANHQSNFDIPIMIATIPTPKGFIAKKELEKMPMVSDWMRYLKCIFMDRSDIRQQVRSINEGAKNIKAGYPVVLFPEGTRSPDGKPLEFKAGGLKLASKSGATIVPVTIDGSMKIMQKGSFLIKPAHVRVTVHQPFTGDRNDTKVAMDEVKEIIFSAMTVASEEV